MSGAAIRVEGLGKVYRIGGTVERYKTLRDTVSQAVAGIGQKVRGLFSGENGSGKKYETIWALKDVSFEVQPGEVVGIIGRNGAGKSTLLKILSRITEPTEGRVEIRGRVGSLLEVGTGFHPELTGRENVYLNGAILGMKRAEVDRKFDEIVAFAEVEKFIDTPVKHYSSGMYLRLAFAVAAHLDPEVLLVDEVLAVGDLEFQKKCLGSMRDAARSGRTVCFVSHQLAAVQKLCDRIMLLDKGRITRQGDPKNIILEYQQCFLTGNKQRSVNHTLRVFNSIKLRQPRLSNATGGSTTSLLCGSDFIFRIPYEIMPPKTTVNLQASIGIKSHHGFELLACPSMISGNNLKAAKTKGEVLCKIPRLPLAPGLYSVDLWIEIESETRARFDDVLQFEVLPSDFYGTGRLPHHKQVGVLIPYEWTTSPEVMQ